MRPDVPIQPVKMLKDLLMLFRRYAWATVSYADQHLTPVQLASTLIDEQGKVYCTGIFQEIP